MNYEHFKGKMFKSERKKAEPLEDDIKPKILSKKVITMVIMNGCMFITLHVK